MERISFLGKSNAQGVMERNPAIPRISIVTPSFNQAPYLEITIRSVIEQNYPDLEYIIIDGGSTDGSVDIIRKYEKYVNAWVSEPDRGQAHALNKGLRMISGEIWGWLCSDDTLAPGALEKISRAFAADPNAAVIYGNCNFIDEKGRVTREKKPGPFSRSRLMRNNFLYQPATFARSDCLKKYGFLDESLHYAMDYEFWLRFDPGERISYLNEWIADYRLHLSSKTMGDTLEMVKEMTQVKKKYGAGFRADWTYGNFLVWGIHYYRWKRRFFAWMARMKDAVQNR